MSQDAPLPAGLGTESVPLKERFYRYRGKVVRFRTKGFDADQEYWALKTAAHRSIPLVSGEHSVS